MKTSLKQYLRYIPAQMGLISKGPFLLDIDKIYPDDTFICSYPKSGNTWLRFLLANMLESEKEITFKNIDDYVHGLHTAKKQINSKNNNRFIKSHYPYFSYYPKTVYIYRDYRDVLVSFYHYQIALKEFNGTFGEFIRSDNIKIPYGTWKNHVTKALQHKEQNGYRAQP